MIEIKLKEPAHFLRVKETLTRMGIANNKDKVLYQSCHILKKNHKYYIVHFKEMMGLDGKIINLTDEDILRTKSIAQLLSNWGLIELIAEIDTELTNNFRVIPFAQKASWTLVQKYTIG